MKTRLILIAAGMAWVRAVGAGLRIMFAYENTPGIAAASPVAWPSGSRITLAPDGATLVMLAHPKCPCTRATIGELALLMAKCQGKVTAHVLFLKPVGAPTGWEQTDLWRSAAAIPGVHVLRDEGGLEARRFQVETSGQTMLYDTGGRLLFSGGITGARGHSGDNAGRDTIVALLNEGTADRSKTFVFGCRLHEPNSAPISTPN